MGRQQRIIPEFMSKNSNDTFRVIMPLKLKLDYENYGNSHFTVIVKNETTGVHSLQEMSPELLYTHFSVEKYFQNGRPYKYSYTKGILEETFLIDTDIPPKFADIKLSEILSEKNIVGLLGWKRDFLPWAKHIYCYLLDNFGKKIIIPHFAVAVYYYYRFTKMREAVLDSRLEDLYVGCDCNGDEATIILKDYRTEVDAAFIHRFVCQPNATQAFDDIGNFIHTYLKYMGDKYPDKEVETIPIKAKFPVKGKFNINIRFSKVYNEDTNEEYYFVHEILNDSSDIGFKKFKRLFQKDSVITEIDDLENLPKVQKEIPGETTEILKVDHATKNYTSNEIATNRKKECESLVGVQIESDELTNEETITLLKIYEESGTGEAVDQSLTESSSNGNKKVRKTVVSSNVELESKELTKREYTHNFDEFNKYVDFLLTESVIENLQVYENKKIRQVIDKKTDKINTKCRIKGREKQYITATFKYNNLYVGLLELENGEKESSSTWVIVSKSFVETSLFNKFLDLYIEDNLSIKEIKDLYQYNSDPKFTTKNHERSQELTKKDLVKWSAGLLGKLSV